jgi:glycogen synthase kinase 3 beta
MEILLNLPPHKNIVQLRYFAVGRIEDEESARLLTLFMDYLPSTLQDVIQDHATGMPLGLVQIYARQLFSALSHLSSRNIVHRDLLPRNVLVDQIDQRLKIADFGCAKIINPKSVNHPHVGSWQYRAIEMLFGATHYSSKAGLR